MPPKPSQKSFSCISGPPINYRAGGRETGDGSDDATTNKQHSTAQESHRKRRMASIVSAGVSSPLGVGAVFTVPGHRLLRPHRGHADALNARRALFSRAARKRSGPLLFQRARRPERREPSLQLHLDRRGRFAAAHDLRVPGRHSASVQARGPQRPRRREARS